METVVERMRRYRARKRLGERIVPVTVNDATLDALIEEKLLPPYVDDREAIARATQMVLEIFAKDQNK